MATVARAAAVPVSSPLSEAPSSVSTANSYATAAQTPVTGSSGEREFVNEPLSFAETRPFPRELENQCQILIEEQLYVKALHMLNQLLLSGQTRKDKTRRPAIIAPPDQLALIMTLTVHPHRTTRLKERDEIEVVSAAWTYLRNLLAIVGPINADLKWAFRFREQQRLDGRRRRRGGGVQQGAADEEDEQDGIIEDRIHNKYADADGLFRSAHDFWSVVGWAFNCSSIYPRRWGFWGPWLDFMLEVIEKDWDQREGLDAQSMQQHMQSSSQGSVSGVVEATTYRRDSLVMSYVRQAGSGRSRTNHITKALLADGQQTSRRLFGEVFRNEVKELAGTAVPDINAGSSFASKVDLDNDEYGGYMNFTDSEGEAANDGIHHTPRATPQTPSSPQMAATTTADVPTSMAESVGLRIRLFSILCIAAGTLQDDMLGFENIKRDFTQHLLREQSLSVFQLSITCLRQQITTEGPMRYDQGSRMDKTLAIFMMCELLHELLPSGYEDPGKYDPGIGRGANPISATTLKHCYLPWHANTDDPDDNARLSLLLEAALLTIDTDDGLRSVPGLRAAALKGVQAREARAKKWSAAHGHKPGSGRGRSRRNAQKQQRLGKRELFVMETLELSGERIMAYIDCMLDAEGETELSGSETGRDTIVVSH